MIQAAVVEVDRAHRCLTAVADKNLCVDESARGKGVGKLLYDYALGFAKSTGCHNVTLHVWDKNPGARAFYQKMGMGVQQTTMEVIL